MFSRPSILIGYPESLKARLSYKAQGTGLLETVIALFILVAAMIVSFRLFGQSLFWQGRAELQQTALFLARQKIEEARVAARDIQEYNQGLPSLVGISQPEANTEVQVWVTSLTDSAQLRLIPSESFEQPYNRPINSGPLNGVVTDDRRILASSLLHLEVEVRSLANHFQAIRLVTLIREPRRELDRIEISAPSLASLSYREAAQFTATAIDQNGDPIPDLAVRWVIEPISSSGTVFQSRSGGVCALEHVGFDFNNVAFRPAPGQCRVRAFVRLGGVEHSEVSGMVELQ